MNCYWSQRGFWWDEAARTTNYTSWSNTSENSNWSSPQCTSYTWGHYLGCPLAQLLLSVPCRFGEPCCLLVICFHAGDASEVVWDSTTSQLSMSPLDRIPVTIPFLLHLWSPKREIRSTLSPPPGGIFSPHPSKLLLTPVPTPMYNGCFLWMLSKLFFDS